MKKLGLLIMPLMSIALLANCGAPNQCIVTFESNGGTHIATQKVKKGETAKEPDPKPTKVDYTFGGWFISPDFAGGGYDFNTPVTEDITLYADWNDGPTPVIPTYTIDFQGENCTSTLDTSKQYHTGDEVSFELAIKDKTQYKFPESINVSGVSTFDYSNQIGEVSFIVESKDIGVVAKADVIEPTVQHTVTFVLNGAISPAIDPVTVNEGDPYPSDKIPANPTKPGHTFKGWSDDEKTESIIDLSKATINSDLILYAWWSDIKTYTVKFYKGDSEFTDLAQTVNYGEKVQRPETPSIGYTFEGWYSDEALTKIFDFAVPLTQKETEIKIYGKFSLEPIICFVTFKKEGQEDIIKSFDSNRLEVVAPTFTASPGYGRWETSDAKKQAFSGETITFTLIELHNWIFTYNGTPNTYTITYDYNGGTPTGVNPTTYNVTQNITLNNPTLTNFTFSKWCLGAKEVNPLPQKDKWNAGDMVGDITLHADWRITDKTLDNYSWQEINDISTSGNASNYFDFGNTKNVTIDSVDYQVRILGFDYDKIATPSNNEPQYAGITFEFVNIINGFATNWNNKDGNNSNSYDFINRSTLNDCLQPEGEVYNKLNSVDGLMDVIKTVNKKVSIHPNNEWIDGNYDTELFPLSYNEVYGSGGSYEFYKTNSKARRTKNGRYWLRSPCWEENYDNRAWYIENEGSIWYDSVYYNYTQPGVAPAFCI